MFVEGFRPRLLPSGAAEIVLSDDERAELVRRAGLPERRRADRARIILACADGMSNAGTAQVLVGFQNSAIGPDLGFYAARSFSLMRPPRTVYRFKTNRRVSDLGIHEIGYAAW